MTQLSPFLRNDLYFLSLVNCLRYEFHWLASMPTDTLLFCQACLSESFCRSNLIGDALERKRLSVTIETQTFAPVILPYKNSTSHLPGADKYPSFSPVCNENRQDVLCISHLTLSIFFIIHASFSLCDWSLAHLCMWAATRTPTTSSKQRG